MNSGKEIKAKEAEHGKKMIEIKVRFWTNGIAKQKDQIVPKHAWSSGVIRIEKNESHDIKPKNPVPFNSLMEITSVIEKVFIQHDICIHPSDRMYRYYECCEE